MPHRSALKFERSPIDDMEEAELSTLVTDFDEGLVAPKIAQDPEHDRLIDPED